MKMRRMHKFAKGIRVGMHAFVLHPTLYFLLMGLK